MESESYFLLGFSPGKRRLRDYFYGVDFVLLGRGQGVCVAQLIAFGEAALEDEIKSFTFPRNLPLMYLTRCSSPLGRMHFSSII